MAPGSRFAQSVCAYVQKIRRYTSTSVFMRSINPSVYGWKAVESLRVIFSSSQTLFQTMLTN